MTLDGWRILRVGSSYILETCVRWSVSSYEHPEFWTYMPLSKRPRKKRVVIKPPQLCTKPCHGSADAYRRNSTKGCTPTCITMTNPNSDMHNDSHTWGLNRFNRMFDGICYWCQLSMQSTFWFNCNVPQRSHKEQRKSLVQYHTSSRSPYGDLVLAQKAKHCWYSPYSTGFRIVALNWN